MPRRQFTSQELQELRDLAAGWGKIIARRAFGDDGPGRDVDLDAMEQIAQAAAAGLNEGALQILLEQQADALASNKPVPTAADFAPSAGSNAPCKCRARSCNRVNR